MADARDMSIPALGGGGAQQAIQRALRDAERALAEELGGTDGENAATTAARAGAGGIVNRAARRRTAGPTADTSARGKDEAIVVELGEREKPEDLKAVGGWITTKRTLETKGTPDPKLFDAADIKEGAEEATVDGRPAAVRVTPKPGQPAAAAAQGGLPLPGEPLAEGTTAQPTAVPADEAEEAAPDASAQAPAARPQREASSLDRMIVVLKKTGIDFRDAYQVLREINTGVKLPPKAELQARWALADPDAWEAKARTEQAPRPGADAAVDEHKPEPAVARGAADADLRKTAVDDVIRDRDWHRANPDGAGRAGNGLNVREDDNRPTLQSVVRHDQTNQAYVAGLSTAEFQRLVTVLGKAAPEWFWDLRSHGGLRGFAERPVVARLNTIRIAGTRLGAWLVAVAGSGTLWYVGVHTGSWW